MAEKYSLGKRLVLTAAILGGFGAAGCGEPTPTLSFSPDTGQTTNTQPTSIATAGNGETNASGNSGSSGSGSGNTSSPEATATPVPIVTNVTLQPGECPILAGGQTYIVGGDVLINGQQPFDNNANTGTEYLITGNQPTPICAEFGAEEHILPNNPSVIANQEDEVYQGLRRSGCVNNAGCSGGVQFVTVENGQIQSVVLHTGQSFNN